MTTQTRDEQYIDDDYDIDDSYDSRGAVTPGGLYDAGGHVIPDRWADLCDFMHDRIKYKE